LQIRRLQIGLDSARDLQDTKEINLYQNALDRQEERKRNTFNMYTTKIKEFAHDISESEQQGGLAAFKQEASRDLGIQALVRFAIMFLSQVSDYRRNSLINEQQVRTRLLAEP
jgi:hypothetical protein